MLSDLTLEMLTQEKVLEMKDFLLPLFQEACEGNEIARDEMVGEDLFLQAVTGLLAVFVGYDKGVPVYVIAIQFNDTNGHRGADIVAIAGKHLLQFKKKFWHVVIEWLRANGVEFIDAYVPTERAKMYLTKFGFNRSCAYVRMKL